MRIALIDNAGNVVNVILAEAGYEAPDGLTAIEHDTAAPGDTWNGSEIVKPAVPPQAPPPVISDRQFFQQLAALGLISQAEALAAVKTGAIPPDMETLVAQLPAEQQFAAQMLISGATQFDRNHPLTDAIRIAFGWTEEQTDDFWRDASAL